MLNVNAEAVVKLYGNPEAVVDALVVATGDVFQAIAHKVRHHRFHRVLANRHGITGQVFDTPRIAGEVIVDVGFLGGQEVVVVTAAEGEGPVVRFPAEGGADDVLIVALAAAGGRVAHFGAGVVPGGAQVRSCVMW